MSIGEYRANSTNLTIKHIIPRMGNWQEGIRHSQEETRRQIESFIPLDKSWIIRMGVLDLLNGRKDIDDFLNKQKNLGGDLLALKKAVESWGTDKPVDVGESATLYRVLQFASWELNLNKKFVTRGTLTKRLRNMTKDPNIVNLSLNELLDLPEKTSQWATASVLCGNRERIPNPPYKLQVSFDAVRHWNKQRQHGKTWEPRPDTTILRQANVFLAMMKGKKVPFTPMQAEDYCFAYAFGYMSREEGEAKWPNLRGHESDRFNEMEEVLTEANAGEMIDSKDHRVVQAIAMWGQVNNKNVRFSYPDAVHKTWPKFWDFLDYAKSFKKLS